LIPNGQRTHRPSRRSVSNAAASSTLDAVYWMYRATTSSSRLYGECKAALSVMLQAFAERHGLASITLPM